MPELTCDVNTVFSTYSGELGKVEAELLNLFNSSALMIPSIGSHVVRSGGKRLRPLFLVLGAELCGYRGHARIVLASVIEAIHTASLLHDDVVDSAELRRGSPTAHSVWGNQIVVLVGDFLYSNALRVAVSQKNQKIMEALSEATARMTEGELLQLSKIGDPEIKEAEYLQIISAKTGALISAACRIGAILGNKERRYEEALSDFGMKTGMAFQMMDDILDYMAVESRLGKRPGKDLEEGKITMPLIYLLQVCDEDEKREVKEIVTGMGTDKGNDERLARLSVLFRKYNTIEESMNRAKGLVREAKEALEVFASSPVSEALSCLADYALYRSS
ncbi:MAG TPA: polyprenyl synthetase family protein [Nitrospirae bacterium]|nr:polyprenyl synthetase family protein [Nitrospirota bacterium]